MRLIRSSLLIAASLSVLLCGSTVDAQEPEAVEDIQQKLQDAMGRLRSTSEVMQARAAAKNAGTDPQSGLPRNIVYQSKRWEGAQAVREIERCVNPPQDFNATYSIAVVRSDDLPRYGPPIGGSGTRFVINEEKYVGEMMAEEAPAPVQEGKPGIRMVFDVGTGDWAYALGRGWEFKNKARELLEPRLDEFDTVSRDEVANVACAVVSSFEDFLSDIEGKSLPDYLRYVRIRDVVNRQANTLEHLRGKLEPIITEASQTSAFERESFLPRVEEARAALAEARTAMEQGRYERAEKRAQAAADSTERAQERVLYLEELERVSRVIEARWEQFDEDIIVRDISFLPHGADVSAQLEMCRELIDSYQGTVAAGRRVGEIQAAQSGARDCVEELGSMLDETEADFNTKVYYFPGVALLVVLIGIPIWLYRRRSRASARAFEVDGLLEEWRRRVPTFQHRLEQLAADFPTLLAPRQIPHELRSETVETIDLAHVMAQRAEQIWKEAEGLLNAAGALEVGEIERAERLLTDEESVFGPDSSRDATRLQTSLRRSHRVRHAEMLDRLEEAIDEAREALEAAEPESDRGGPAAW